MSRLMYGGQGQWWSSADPLRLWEGYARAVGADAGSWRGCMSAGKHRAAIEADRQLGVRMGVNATPTVFVGARRIVGARPFETYARAVRAEMAGR